MEELRVIIAGSRQFNDYNFLRKKVDDILLDSVFDNIKIKIISGTARGADYLGEKYGNERGYEVVRFPADWNGLGKKAGYVRNSEMAKFAVENNNIGVLVAFWDGESKGTKHMIDLARKHNLEVYVIHF